MLSVIIPSRNMDNLAPCVQAVRQHDPAARVIVMDDGLDESDVRSYHFDIRVRGTKPFIFARAVNEGLRVAWRTAEPHDVILLNDDAILESPGGFSQMQRLAAEHPEAGLISATTNLAGNLEQHRRAPDGFRWCTGPTPGNSFATVAFVCVLIPRATIEAVGMLDERFTAYGWEDNDYCRRVHQAGLKIGIADSCYVDHARLHSTFRGGAYAAGDINAGRKIYLEKWGSL